MAYRLNHASVEIQRHLAGEPAVVFHRWTAVKSQNRWKFPLGRHLKELQTPHLAMPADAHQPRFASHAPRRRFNPTGVEPNNALLGNPRGRAKQAADAVIRHGAK